MCRVCLKQVINAIYEQLRTEQKKINKKEKQFLTNLLDMLYLIWQIMVGEARFIFSGEEC